MQLLWKTTRQFLQRLRIESPYRPAILRLVMYPKELKTGIQIKTYSFMLTVALFTVAKR